MCDNVGGSAPPVQRTMKTTSRLVPLVFLGALAAGCAVDAASESLSATDVSTSSSGGSDAVGGADGGTDASTGTGTAEGGGATVPTHTVFLAFDPETITSGSADDPTRNESLIVNQPVTLSFDEAAMDTTKPRAEILDDIVAATADHFTGFPIEVTRERPSDGDYVMVMVGGAGQDIASFFSDAGNLALVDCDDAMGWPAMTFVFPETNGVLDDLTYAEQVERLARLAAASVGTSVGLSQVLECGDVMGNPFNCTETSPVFLDEPTTCGQQQPDECVCGGTRQSSADALRHALTP